ncbi:MAG TPA: hypothetical protein VJA23_03065 [Candidatus Nanoarchaeia archaeon]|nr:hypothetical protein [Candidatus Nanoarchaeia archaeon]
MKLIQTVMDCIRRYSSERDSFRREADYFWSDLDPKLKPALDSTSSAAFELGLYEERVSDKEDREKAQKLLGSKTIDDLPILGVMYEDLLSAEGAITKPTGFLLVHDGTLSEVKFKEGLSPLRLIPKGMSYDEAMSRVPEGRRYYFERYAINHLRQVLHIHDPEDPLLNTPIRNLDAPVEIFHLSGNKASRYQPLSDEDCGLVVGFLNSTFSQMRERRWF